MKTQNRQFDKNSGSALILVVVVTVLLAVVGVMFLMISRAGEAQSGAVVQSKDLSAAVDTVVNRINDVLVDDLFGQMDDAANPGRWQRDNVMVNGGAAPMDMSNIFSDEPWDAVTQHRGYNEGKGDDNNAGTWDDMIDPVNGVLNRSQTTGTGTDVWLPGQVDDPWLASIEPVRVDLGSDGKTGTADDVYSWPQITDLWGTIQTLPGSLFYQRFVKAQHILYPQTQAKVWLDPEDDEDTDQWATGTSVWDDYKVAAQDVRVKVIAPGDRTKVILQGAAGTADIPNPWDDETKTSLFGARADADGDGVADSRWVQIPNLTASHGEPVFAAVRIIDNCAMLNLNAANCFYHRAYSTKGVSPYVTQWEAFRFNTSTNRWDPYPYHDNITGSGRYLTELDYFPFLRGHDLNGNKFDGDDAGDYWANLMRAKGFVSSGVVNISGVSGAKWIPWPPQAFYYFFLNIENPNPNGQFFDVGDELELRNRYLLTSLAEARFERSDVANFTLDSGSGKYAALQVPIDEGSYKYGTGYLPNISKWKFRIDALNFDKWSGAFTGTVNGEETDYSYRYDRRHVSTFYSFDRTLRAEQPPLSYAQILNDTGWTPRWTPQQVAATKQSIFWYPLLYQELKDAGVKPTDIVAAQQLFWPVGPVTTDIASPDEMLKVLKGDPSDPGRPYNNPETRRRILHLLFAFREYFYEQGKPDEPDEDALKNKAALRAAQVVANLIDYADNSDRNTLPLHTVTDGPFYEVVYGSQGNTDCTFITSQIIDEMINEAYTSMGLAVVPMDFGLTNTDIVFGYERQPFISEVYAKRNASTGAVEAFAVELLNPYADDLKLARAATPSNAAKDIWRIKAVRNGSTIIDSAVGGISAFVPKYDVAGKTCGRYVIRSADSVSASLPAFTMPSLLNMLSGHALQLLRPAPKWVEENMGIDFLVVDEVSSEEITDLFTNINDAVKKRDDTNWRFIHPEYEMQKSDDGTYANTLGQPNGVTLPVSKEFQLAVADNGLSPVRLHELETLAVQGNGPTGDPNSAITLKVSDSDTIGVFDFDDPANAALLNYVQPLNRPLLGSLPGRININTAPVYVIAAAIPPSLVDPAVADGTPVTFSALQAAQAIVEHRETKPFAKVSELLDVQADSDGDGTPEYVFKRYHTDGLLASKNVGNQSIGDDAEERDWILSNLANKFTVRSDTFTAYILVRLGTNGPQRRMIAIFDRSQVWDKNDRPRLVALHPVPDPH